MTRNLASRALFVQSPTVAAAWATAPSKESRMRRRGLRNSSAAATARGAQFTNQITAFNASPTVYPQRLFLQTFAEATRHVRKYIVGPTNTDNVIQINLEDKIRPDLLDVTVPTAK